MVLHVATGQSTQAPQKSPGFHLSPWESAPVWPQGLIANSPCNKWANWFRWIKSYTRTVRTFALLLSMFYQMSEILGLGWNQRKSTRIFLKYSSSLMRTVKHLWSELYCFYFHNALIYQDCFTENFDTALPWRRSEFKIWHLELIKHIRNSKWINWFSHYVV